MSTVPVVGLSRVYLRQLSICTDKFVVNERRLKDEAKPDPETVRLQTVPGVGPMSAMATKEFSPPLEGFKRRCDFAARFGFVPVRKSTGERRMWAPTSKIGPRDIQRLLIIGAMTRVRWVLKTRAPKGSWLEQILDRKPVCWWRLRSQTKPHEQLGP